MDERKVADLFRAAAQDPPPASFDADDVAARSRQVTLRRRSMLAGGGGLAVVVLAVGLLLGTGVFGPTRGGGTPTAAIAQAPSDRQGAGPFAQHSLDGPGSAGPQLRGPSNFPTTSPEQGGGDVGGVGPGAGSTRDGCGPADGKLAVALASALPAAGAPTTPPDTVLACAQPTRSASYRVPDGYVTALLVPSGTRSGYVADRGSRTASGPSASGHWQVTVVLAPATPGQAPPLADRLAAITAAVRAAF